LGWLFFVMIPFINDKSPISITSTSGGPCINFDTINQLANHMIDNINFYKEKHSGS